MIAGRYVLGRLLGAGGMAQVFQARDELLGRDVAVKVFGPSLDAHGPDRVRAEISTLAGLSHPALVTVHDAGTDIPNDGGPERAFLVMELIDGPTLAQLIAAGPLAPELVASTGASTASALAHVHARGVVHRDLKPANILLDAQRRAHLADFGIAQTLGLQALTATGLLMGTAPYLSPEQVEGRPVTVASDVYSLGLVLLEALTGRREYAGMSAETAIARLTRPPAIDETLPAPWPELLAAMTSFDADARPTAAQVAETLFPYGVTGAVPAAAPEDALTVAAPMPTRLLVRPATGRPARVAVVAVGSVLAVLVLVGVGATLNGKDGGQPASTPTSSPTATVQPVASVPATPSPTRPATTKPASSGKGKGHGPGK